MEPNGTRWQDAFTRGGHPPGRGMGGIPPMPRDEPPDTEGSPDLDLAEYKPWVLQRGGRPAMMIDFRRYDARSGLWTGWAVSYPHLVALEYTGDRMLSLDFGNRQFIIEGAGLGELTRRIQEGTVLIVQEYTPTRWPYQPEGPLITAILNTQSGAR